MLFFLLELNLSDSQNSLLFFVLFIYSETSTSILLAVTWGM